MKLFFTSVLSVFCFPAVGTRMGKRVEGLSLSCHCEEPVKATIVKHTGSKQSIYQGWR